MTSVAKTFAAKTFTCKCCGNNFEFERENWSDEQAYAEYDERFTEEKAAGEERDIVCDKCYNRIMKYKKYKEGKET